MRKRGNMTGRLKNITFNGEKQTITIELNGDFRDKYDQMKDEVIKVEIRKHYPRRNMSANKYFHVLVNAIAEKMGVGEHEIKAKLVCDYGVLLKDSNGNNAGVKLPESVDVCLVYPYSRCFDIRVENGIVFRCYLLYKRTRFMNTKEMCRLIDGAVSEAKNLGIETDTPDEIARLKSLWKKREEQSE